MAERTRLQEYTGNKDEAQQAYLYGLQGIPLGVAANIMPPVIGGADSSDWTNYLPFKGMAGLAYGGITGLADLGMNQIGKPAAQFMQRLSPEFASVTPTIPNEDVHVPGGEGAREITRESVRSVLNAIPHAEPTTDAEKVGQDIGIGIGQGASAVVPPGVTALPRLLSLPLRSALPPASTAGIGAIAGGVSGAMAPPELSLPEVVGQEGSKTELPAVVGHERTPTTPLPSDNDTGWSYGQAALATGAVLGLAWLGARAGPQMLNATADALRGRSRNIVDLNALVDSPIPRNGPPIEMMMPNDAGGLSRRLARNAYNPNAVMNELATGLEGKGTQEADLLKSANEMVNNPSNANRRMEALFRTGAEEGSGHSFPKIVDYKRTWDTLGDDQKTAANYAAWYKNELNVRDANLRSGMSEADSRVSFTGVDTAEMRKQVAAAEADPQVKAWLDANKAIQSAIVDSYETRGMITPAQANHARNVYPDFMPTIGAEGEYLHSWDGRIREPGSGYRDLPTDAWQAMINHFDKSIRTAQKNEWQRTYVLRLAREQAADPAFPKLLTETAEPSGLRRSITINTAAGPRHFDIHNTALYSSLTSNPHNMGIGMGVANNIRQFYQNMTTGPLAMIAGHPFAIKQAIRDMALIPAQAGKGAYRGYLDRATGLRLPYDPTFPIGSVITGAKDVSTVTASHMADMLGSRTNPMSASLRKVFGHDAVDSWVDWMRARIAATSLAERQAIGVGGGGNRNTQQMEGFTTTLTGSYRDPTSSSVSPMLNHPNFVLIPDRVPLPNVVKNTANGIVRGSAESYLSLRALARDLYNVISDAPHSFYHDINKGNPKFTPRTLAREVQDVTGNPGTRGIGKVTQALSRTVPFYNASVQGTGRALAAFRDRPIAMGTTVASILIPLALAEHISALVSGKEHVDHLENQTSNGTKARNGVIYHGQGTDPNQHTEIPIPNEWQAIFPFISGLVGHAVGSWNAHADEDSLTRISHMISNVFDHHVTTDVLKQTDIGVAGQIPLDVSPHVGLIVAGTTGEQMKNIPEQMINNLLSGQPLGSNMTMGGGVQKQGPPGQKDTDRMTLSLDAATLKAVMSSLGAAGGAAYDLANNYVGRAKVDKEWAWTGLLGDYKQEWQDQTPYLNHVWQHNLKQSSYGSLEERTMNMWRNIAPLTGASSEMRGEGFTKSSGGAPILVNTQALPQDPQMRDLYLHTAQMGKSINREIMPRINEIRAQIDNLKQSPFQPEEKRRIGNKLSSDLYDQYTKLHERLLDLNSQLSGMAGDRHVDVASHIKWDGNVEQFHH